MSDRPRRTVRQRLEDILEALTRIEAYTHAKTFRDFAADPMLRDSVERNIERISEASRHLPKSLKADRLEIPWRAIGDIGNVFRHAYDDVDSAMTWRVVERDLAALREAVVDLIARADRGEER